MDCSQQTPYANHERLLQMYYSKCLQDLIVALETSLDYGLGLVDVPGKTYGTEFDIDDLLWMDTATRTKAATDAVTGGVLSPNEARAKYFGLGRVAGGESCYMQQQNWPLVDLGAPAVMPAAVPAAAPGPAPTPEPEAEDEEPAS